MKKRALVEMIEITDNVTDYNNILFKNTNFSNRDLDSFEFVDCTFMGCDFSMSKLSNAVLTRVKFLNCKLLGVDFSVCSSFAFSVSFDECLMNYILFHKNDLRKTKFKTCQIKEANFFETNLNSAKFENCDLSDTIFDRCDFSKADFRTASNYIINPNDNSIKKAQFSYPGLLGLLGGFDIEIE
jgi:uncharacterized protein YjbI with pentapeptide repeats